MSTFWTLVRKDLVVEGRAREMAPAMVVLVLLLLAMMGAAGLPRQAAPAVLWIAVATAAATGLIRSFHQETDQDQLHALVLAAVDPAVIYLGKAAANFVVVMAVEIVALGALVIFFDLSFPPRLASLAVLHLGTAALVALGTLLGALLTASRMREALLPVLLLPLGAPAVMAATTATARLLDASGGAITGELRLLAAFTLLCVAISVLVFEQVIGD